MLNLKIVGLICVLTISGCASIASMNKDAPRTENSPYFNNPSRAGNAIVPSRPVVDDAQLDGSSSPQIFSGTGKVINLPKIRPVIQLAGGEVTLNFEEAPLEDVVHGILGDILKLDYIIEGSLGGVVTLRSQSAITHEQLLPILESILQSRNVVMVRDNNNRYIISSSATIKGLFPGFENPATTGAGYSHVIIPLEHIGAVEMAEILSSVAAEESFVRIDALRNLLVLAGTRIQIEGWSQIISTFDVDLLAGMSVAIFPIEYSNVEEVALALGTLLAGGVGADSTALTGLVRIVPLDTLGSILVVTPKKKYLDKIQTWIERLDRAPDYGVEPQLFVYKVQNGSADHLAQLISGIYGGTGGGARRGSGISPGLTPTSLDGGGAAATTQQRSTTGRASTSSFSLGDDIRIVADSVNNALLVFATHTEYRKIESALEQLDVVPLQVLIEASILEVTLTDDLSYGLEWYLDNSLGNGWRGTGQLNISSGGIGLQAPGFAYAFNNPLGQLRAVLNTLADKRLVRVISTPSIMVLDNQKASISVGSQHPIKSAEISGSLGANVTTTISYIDTGVTLDVEPSVNASGLVTMNIVQTVIDVGPIDPVTRQVGFFDRSIESRVAVRSGQSVVLGGLISSSNTRGKAGLPFFQNLPIIGGLFGKTTIAEKRTELLVIITPYVISNEQDLRDITREMRERMKTLSIFDLQLEE